MTPEGKKFCGQIYKEQWRNEVGQVKSDTRVKSIKSDSDEQKRYSVFQEKINRGDTAELATKKVARFFRKK